LAIFILAAGIVGVLGMFSLGVKAQVGAKMSQVALGLARAKLEELISLPYPEIESISEDYGQIPGFEFYQRQVDVSHWDPANCTTSQTDSGIKMIKVAVFWDQNRKNSEVVTLFSKK